MNRHIKLGALAVAAAAAISTPAAASTTQVCAPGGPWTQTWNSALDHGQPVGPFTNQTLRMVVHTSVGGSQLRLDLSNEVEQALGLHFQDDEGFQQWVEGPGNLEVLCANHHTSHYGVHVVPAALWEAIRFHRAGAPAAAEFVAAKDLPR